MALAVQLHAWMVAAVCCWFCEFGCKLYGTLRAKSKDAVGVPGKAHVDVMCYCMPLLFAELHLSLGVTGPLQLQGSRPRAVCCVAVGVPHVLL